MNKLKIWSKLENFNFWKIIKFDHFFNQNVKSLFGVLISIKPIDTLFLLHGMSFDEKHPRKWPQNKFLAYKTFSNFSFKTLTSQKCCRPSVGRFARTPYYSSRIGWNILLYESLWFTILTCLRAFVFEN